MSSLWDFSYLRGKVNTFFLRLVSNLLYSAVLPRDRELALSTYAAFIETIDIPTSDTKDKTRKIKAHLYTPPSVPASPGSPKPVVINWHGSGWTIPCLGSDVALAAHIAKDVDAYVVDADYRKAPEDPFPAALDDVKDVLDWVATQPERFDASRVAVAGASAGGTLALVASSTLRKSLKVDIRAAVAHYPVTDLSLRAEDRVIPKPVRPMPASLLETFYSNYVGADDALRKDPRVSPMYADMGSYPAMVVIVACGGDTLSVEAMRLADKLDDGSRKVVSCVLEDMNHGYDIGAKPGTKLWDSREKAHSMIIEALKESFGKE